jgi:hypothetical protein
MSLVLRIPWGRSLAPFLHQTPSLDQDSASNILCWSSRLVEETEAHVVVRLLLLLLSLLGLGGGLSGTTSGGSTTSRGGTSTTRGNGGELLRAGRDQLDCVLVVACRRGTSHVRGCAVFACRICAYLVDVLALELLKERGEALLVGVNANGAEDRLDVLSGRRRVAGQAEEEESCEVLHVDGVWRKGVSGVLCGRRGAGRKQECTHCWVGWFKDKRINHV